MYLKTREYGGASFVDKKTTVIFYQKNFSWIVLEGKKDAFWIFQKKIYVGFLSTNDAPPYSRFVDFLSTIHR